MDGLEGRRVRMANGVMQGSAHGPLCFNLYYDIVIRLLNRGANAGNSYMVEGVPMVTRAFADDLVLVAKN